MGLMPEYRHGSHSVFEIHLHLVWVTKYRKPVLSGAVGSRVRDPIRGIGGASDVPIIEGHVSKDHVHLLVSITPRVTIRRLVQRLKGKTAYKLLGEFAHLRKGFWGRHVWARGYFCCSGGNVTYDVVPAYVENQGIGQSGDFRVEGSGESLQPAFGRGLEPSSARKTSSRPWAGGLQPGFTRDQDLSPLHRSHRLQAVEHSLSGGFTRQGPTSGGPEAPLR